MNKMTPCIGYQKGSRKNNWTKNRFILIILLLLSYGMININSVNGQSVLEKTFSVNVKNVKLKNVISDVQKQTSVSFSYSATAINVEKVVSYNATKMKLSDFLQDIQKKYGINFKVVENRIILFKANTTSNDEKIEIKTVQSEISTDTKLVKGIVTNEKGETMSGVTVLERGKNNGTSTNEKGEFSIKITSKKPTIIFSYTGFQANELSVVPDMGLLKVTLNQTVKSLDDVIVIGYGTIKKSDLTGSVSKVKFENANQETSSSFEQLLQGKAAGVNITQTSGDPGSGIVFNIRGSNSLGANQPLIVIDGVPIESDNNTVNGKTGADYWTSQQQPTNVLASLNPNDIESIEILKDASSTAIFGSRGANGVVMITTKRGKAGKDRLSYTYRNDASQLSKKIAVLNSKDFATYANEAAYNSDSTLGHFSKFTSGKIDSALNIFWQDMIFARSSSQDHQLSLSGGDDRTKYAISANYSDIIGAVKNTFFRKEGISFNLDRQYSKDFKIGITTKLNLSDNRQGLQSTNHPMQGGSVISTALRSSPLGNPFTIDGEINTSLQYNPVSVVANSVSKTSGSMILANLFGEYSIIPNELRLKVSGSVNQNLTNSSTYWGRGTVTGDAVGGQAYKVDNKNINYLTEYTLNYTKMIHAGHRINAVAGYTSQNWASSANGLNAKGFPNDDLGADGFAYATNILSLPVTKLQKWQLQSYLARFNYTINDKYLMTLTGRTDGSSRLAPGHKWDFFPSIALGWNIYKEHFLSKLSFISNAKIRTSYGFSGNQNIGVGSTQALLISSRAATGYDTLVSGETINTFANPKLHWEKTGQLDIGFDIAFQQDKYQLTIDYYKKTTTDLLLSLPIPSDNGFSTYPTNLGKVENSGIEIEGNVRFALTKKLSWRIAANVAFNQNKVINLGENGQINGSTLLPTSLDQYGTIAIPGHAIGSFYGYRTIGIYQNKAEIAKSPIDAINPTPGDIKYADLNGDGKIDADDRTILGNPNPKYTFGITNTFNFKAFEFSFFILGKIGQSVLNLNRYYSDGLVYSTSGNLRQEVWDNRWKGEGTSNYYPRAKTTGSLFDKRLSDRLVEDASFIRLKNISLSYNFNVKSIKYLNSLKVFANATNLFIITKYKGFDPEVSGFGLNAINQGVDFGTIPQYKTFSFGVNVGF